MLLECNEIKLLIVNMDEMPSEFDGDLSKLISFKKCVFILSDNLRTRKLQENILGFTYTAPSGWLSFPNSQTISKILRENDIAPYEAVYVTGNPQEPYNNLGVSTILLLNNENTLDKNNLPDHYVTDIPSLIMCLQGNRYGYYGELCADGTNGVGWFLFSKLHHDLIPAVETDLIVFGRYFVSHDSRSYIHPLSQMILQMKSGYQNQVNTIAKVFSKSLNHLYTKGFLNVDTITVVPPKVNKRNVLLEVVNKSKDLGNDSLNAQINIAELLRLRENYRPQKEVGSFTNRILNVRGKFEATQKISGNIVLVDDIITSGATALECAKVLYEAGADKVTVLAFGASQNRSEAPIPDHLKCDNCEDGEYRIRFGRSAFYGCTNFPSCRSNITYERGRKRYNATRLNSTIQQDDDDIF